MIGLTPSRCLALTLGALVVAGGCAGLSAGRIARHALCSGFDLELDTVRERCLVEGLTRPENLASPDGLRLAVSLQPPASLGGDISVSARVINVSGVALVLDLTMSETSENPRVELTAEGGGPLPAEKDESCTDWRPPPPMLGGQVGGVVEPLAVSRVTLAPGGSVRVDRTVASRRGRCVCGADENGDTEMRCDVAAGGALEPGTYGVDVSMPIAVRADGIRRVDAYGYLLHRAAVTIGGEVD